MITKALFAAVVTGGVIGVTLGMASTALAHHFGDEAQSLGECDHSEAVNYEALEQ